MTTIVYIIGFFVSYFLLRYQRVKDKDTNDWETVIQFIFFSFLSWFAVIITIIIIICVWSMNTKLKPPKWL